jgi:hypothetical protein
MSIACDSSRGNAPDVLLAFLMASDYSQHCRERILAYVLAEGTFAGCPELDQADETFVERIWCQYLPAVPQTDPAWCDGGAEYTLPDAELEAMSAHEEEWCYPPRRQVSPVELSQIAAHGCV